MLVQPADLQLMSFQKCRWCVKSLHFEIAPFISYFRLKLLHVIFNLQTATCSRYIVSLGLQVCCAVHLLRTYCIYVSMYKLHEAADAANVTAHRRTGANMTSSTSDKSRCCPAKENIITFGSSVMGAVQEGPCSLPQMKLASLSSLSTAAACVFDC